MNAEIGIIQAGANQDSYAEAGAIGHAAASTQNFAANPAETAAAFGSPSRSVASAGPNPQRGSYDRTDLFDGEKEAEADIRRRRMTN